MEKQPEALKISEMETVAEAILRLVYSYNEFPAGITPQWDLLEKEEAIGIFSMPGAAYLKKNIVGGFKAQVPFRIVYQSVSDGNTGRIKSQTVLDKLAEWMENTQYPPLTGGRRIESIERKSPVFAAGKSESGDVYQCNFNLIYRKD